MRILKDTLEPFVETWDDPGDYPSGAGSGPLPSYDYFAGWEGELVVELTDEEIEAWEVEKELDHAPPMSIRDETYDGPWEWVLEKREGRVFTFYAR